MGVVLSGNTLEVQLQLWRHQVIKSKYLHNKSKVPGHVVETSDETLVYETQGETTRLQSLRSELLHNRPIAERLLITAFLDPGTAYSGPDFFANSKL